ncbi:hypothetical protein HU200_060334 [Digitaria exilis]|uniref:Hydrophobic seed protein domain-containing protein n=1 Tax=Digitaria exilis TaxID=1010633 RepID=A0A835DYV0_9POAL|nr:hypothetical protein HU200_060334 [Digitaria exilis]
MGSKLMITMTLFFPAAVHGCEPSCSNPTPPPPLAVPTPSGATCPIGTADLSVSLCVCGVIKVLNLAVPVDVTILLNKCGMSCPPGFTCPLY